MAKLSEENKGLYLKVSIDTEDAVKSLKSLQRVARETAKGLRAVDFKNVDLSVEQQLDRFSTSELTEALSKRKGIKKFVVYPYGKMNIEIDNDEDGFQLPITGPAIVLVNQD